MKDKSTSFARVSFSASHISSHSSLSINILVDRVVDII